MPPRLLRAPGLVRRLLGGLGDGHVGGLLGGGLFGGRGGPLDNYVGDVTRYVLKKAPCRVILTAPAARDGDRKAALPSRATGGEATPSNR